MKNNYNLFEISTKLSYLMNFLYLSFVRLFVSPSVGILSILSQSTLNYLACTSWRSQWWWILIYFNLVSKRGSSLIINLMVYRLSQLSEYFSLRLKWILSKNLLYYITFLAVEERANNSALVLKIIIIFYLKAF